MKNPALILLIGGAVALAMVLSQHPCRDAGVCAAPSPAPADLPPVPTPSVAAPFRPAPDSVVAAAAPRGRAIAGEAFGLLSSNLLQAIAKGGISNALSYCSLKALALTEAAALPHGVQLARVTHRPRNPQNRADAAEQELLEAYRGALGRGALPLQPVVLTNSAGTARFYSPIVITNPLCLNCHGTPGAELLPGNHALIRRLYPEDEAVGFKTGDLRGLWRVEFRLDDLRATEVPSRARDRSQ